MRYTSKLINQARTHACMITDCDAVNTGVELHKHVAVKGGVSGQSAMICVTIGICAGCRLVHVSCLFPMPFEQFKNIVAINFRTVGNRCPNCPNWAAFVPVSVSDSMEYNYTIYIYKVHLIYHVHMSHVFLLYVPCSIRRFPS